MKRHRSAEDHRAAQPPPAEVTVDAAAKFRELIPYGCWFDDTVWCLGPRCVAYRARGVVSERCMTADNECR